MIICPWCDTKQEEFEENGEIVCRKCDKKIGDADPPVRLLKNTRPVSVHKGVESIRSFEDPFDLIMRPLLKKLEEELTQQIVDAGLDPVNIDWRPVVKSIEQDPFLENNRISIIYGVEIVGMIPREDFIQ